MSRYVWFLAPLVWIMIHTPLNAGTVSAKADGVEVYESANKSSNVLRKMKKGEELESLDRKGVFWEVKLGSGKTGFVFLSAVSKNVDDSSTNLAKALRSANREDRQADEEGSARTRTSVMGVRGLDESSTVSSAGDVRPNLRMVYDMEDRIVSRKKIEQLSTMVQSEMESQIK